MGYDLRVEQATSAGALDSPFKTGIATCWLSLLSLPLDLAALGGGPCFGARDAIGSIVVICAGLAGLVAAGYGVDRVIRCFRRLSVLGRALGLLSIVAAGSVALVTTFFLFVGVLSLFDYLRM